MNIQIFYKSNCFDSKKAERWFKERRIKVQMIDLNKKGMSRGELESVLRAIGSVDLLADTGSKHKDALLLKYLASDSDKFEKLLENPALIKSPVVRNGRLATVGYCPDVWESWQ